MNILELISKIKPNEIYNFAAQSHVQVSFQLPDYSSNVAALGPLRILEVIKNHNKKIRFYQASTSEMYGNSNLLNQKKLHLHQIVLTQLQNYMLFGLLKLIEMHMAFLQVMAFFSIMKVHLEVKHLLLRKLLNLLQKKK